ncbi:ABC transporter substrate-binding protein [Pseudodesulfovibrio senegalensis]|uniref:Thiamine pyrimidine synthase n=1 Tax=Pseudodesulfovibrio senegalensis TaxID=1721087 RepID=A0A6N6N0M6_9BACT|nr:ABC transporter substrate-binding protein [Pseudodesulfovibrio senegalensis]KAB1441283.1 ABC transporter substrate-binding protein [Pseudodesulfovibrio senegalensis]
MFRLGLLWTLAVVLVFPALAHAQKPRRAKLVLQWYAQAQFAGYLVAEEKGFYTKRGVDLKVVPGGADVMVSDCIASGKADFGTMFLSTAIERRGAGMKLVNIGQIVQQSALMLVARKDSGIEGLPDLEGARIGMWGRQFQLQPRALFKRLGISVDVVQQSPSFDLFMRGGLDAVSAMWYNEYHTLMSYGLDPDEMVTFFFSDLDLDFPEDGIYCLEKTWEQDPAMCRAVLEGSLEGWRYAFAHPDEALEIVITRMKQQKVCANRAHQRWMLARMRDIILDGSSVPRGVLRRGDYERTKATLLGNGFIWAAPEYTEFYKGPAQ